ncbi:hypothetical protein ZC98_001516 [Salmonella enterica subsp. enterica]|uniref:hypothetical protein n=1 Tax=Citrobacter braakii TaxID=57706 RepID=UPI0011774AEA|nr:hypothetical protein [Citrobacter braakii]EDV0068544.1 hypothetical protein [Salmonella enterica subsp. enterica serovar Litchfield]QXC16557.1 hypothetical protein I6L51_26845 [Citrobacter braakii]
MLPVILLLFLLLAVVVVARFCRTPAARTSRPDPPPLPADVRAGTDLVGTAGLIRTTRKIASSRSLWFGLTGRTTE